MTTTAAPADLAAITRAGPSPVASSRGKRALDVTLAVTALIVFLPLLLLIAFAIWAESGGPVLFRQRRTGLGGKTFRIFKFRTMRVQEDGESVLQATRGDPRVTRVGAVLRRLSLDELPQLLNVLKGDMSVVGPRPHALSHDRLWAGSVQGYSHRFRARPGLTGRAQVLGLRGEVTCTEMLVARVAADNDYIDAWSFAEDMALILRTVPLLLGDEQAF